MAIFSAMSTEFVGKLKNVLGALSGRNAEIVWFRIHVRNM
jgi:hypothetical protein